MQGSIKTGSINKESKGKMISHKLFFKLLALSIFILLTTQVNGQQVQKTPFFQKSDTLNKKRRNAVYITAGTGAAIAIAGLNQLWYADYPRSSFHSLNDNSSWMLMDKFGHAMSTYFIGKVGMDALAWAGESKKNQLLYGATMGWAFVTTIEIFDGFSQEWGFSTGDVIANTLGAGLLIGQELLWNEQRIQYKFSFNQSPYPEMIPGKLGDNLIQQIVKDYNGQTYWFSINLWSFFKESKIPKWLNVAIGYGANGLPENSYDFGLHPPQPIESYRQFFTSIDVDLTKIKTNSPFLKTIFNVFNYLKVPAPTIEYRSNGEFKFHAFYF